MSNILIIKHGSLGDIVQISGVLKDIREAHKGDKIFILTTLPYVTLLSKCPYTDAVLVDNRQKRWNIFYLIKLSKLIKKYNFSQAYDLQNSSRTSFYRKYLFNIKNWNSTETTLKKGVEKNEFDKEGVLKRFEHQLNNFGIKTKNTLNPDFSWATTDVSNIVNKYFGKKFILLLPFCSPQLSHKKWPYYNELIKIIKLKHPGIEIAVAPGPKEIEEGKLFNAISILNKGLPLNIMELAGLIKKSSFVIANDTGPAHMAAHLGKPGLVIFGSHTTPEKVSIETKKFKAVTNVNLKDIKAEDIYIKIKEDIESIN